jgi:REP element-mobilizing transposase RayT
MLACPHRKTRVDTLGALHHTITRGIERKPIFKDKIDYVNFIDRWSKVLVATGTACFAWALITNHFHFILKANQSNPSEFMKHFLVTYTVRFNRKHQGTGHLFQGRYKSLMVEEDAYLFTLNRYIYLNPVRTLEQ